MTVLFGSSACPVVVSASLSKKRRRKKNDHQQHNPKKEQMDNGSSYFSAAPLLPPSISRYCVVIDVCKAFNYFRLKRALTAAFFCGVGR